MTQTEALEEAVGALNSYSEGGNDVASEAAGVVSDMLDTLRRKGKRAKSRRNWNKLDKILASVPAEFRSSKK